MNSKFPDGGGCSNLNLLLTTIVKVCLSPHGLSAGTTGALTKFWVKPDGLKVQEFCPARMTHNLTSVTKHLQEKKRGREKKSKLLQNGFKILQLLKAVAIVYIKIRRLFPAPHRENGTSRRTAFRDRHLNKWTCPVILSSSFPLFGFPLSRVYVRVQRGWMWW